MNIKNRIEITKGDITKLNVDAVVNAANESLLGGGGVDGAIHRSAGPELLEECIGWGGCKPGEAKITKGYNLPAKWIIHTVGPIWMEGNHNEDTVLRNCYENCLAIAEKYSIKTIAFPSISTGAYGFPIERASDIAIKAAVEYLCKRAAPEIVIFACFSKLDYSIYVEMFRKYSI